MQIILVAVNCIKCLNSIYDNKDKYMCTGKYREFNMYYIYKLYNTVRASL